jgi:CheY-specific phosphatase CheX
MGEVGNVVAGQAKTIMGATPFDFTFSLPRVVSGTEADVQPRPGQKGFGVAFSSDAGDFALQLFPKT